MAIFQRENIWYVDYTVGKGKHRRRVRQAIGNRKTDAIAYLGKIHGAKRENKLFDMKKEYNYTFNDLLERYKEAYKGQSSYKTKACYFPVLKKFFAGRLLSEITLYDLEKFRNKRKATRIISKTKKTTDVGKIRKSTLKPQKERSYASVNRTLSSLRHMFSKAVEWDMMEKSPFINAKNLFYKENNMRLRFLTEDEEERLLFYCIEYLQAIVITALNTGMRKGEVLSLKWTQIRNGFIYLTKTKSREPRQTPINKTLRALFKSLPRHIRSDYVFCDKEGRPHKDVKRSFPTALKKSCIEDFRFHDLRHSFASRLVMKGAGLKAAQELLGCKSIKMTMRYSHLSEDFKKAAVELLDRTSPDCQSSSNLTESKPTFRTHV